MSRSLLDLCGDDIIGDMREFQSLFPFHLCHISVNIDLCKSGLTTLFVHSGKLQK